MIAYPVQVEDAMLIVPVNLPSFEVPAVPPQTASSSPSTTGNTRRDGPYERFNMRPLPRSFGAFSTAAPSAPAGQRAAHATEHRHQAAKRWAKRTAGRRYDSPVQAKAAESLLAFAEQTVPGLRGLDGRATSFKIEQDRKSTRLNSSHRCISYAVFCLKKKKEQTNVHGVRILIVVVVRLLFVPVHQLLALCRPASLLPCHDGAR